MAIQIHCPRCTQHLSVPTKRAGSYVQCPRCQGQFWMAKDAKNEVSPPSAGQGLSGALPPLSPIPGGAESPSAATLASPAAPPQAPPKHARFVAAEPSDSSLRLAADGQLPYLQLLENNKTGRDEPGRGTIHPWALWGGLALSVALSIALALIDFDPTPAATSQEKAAALEIIEAEYFGNTERGPLAPYQVALRVAKQARCRGDVKTEHQHYLKVLDLLRAESRGDTPAASAIGLDRGITGSRDRDRRLQHQIVTLLEE